MREPASRDGLLYVYPPTATDRKEFRFPLLRPSAGVSASPGPVIFLHSDCKTSVVKRNSRFKGSRGQYITIPSCKSKRFIRVSIIIYGTADGGIGTFPSDFESV